MISAIKPSTVHAAGIVAVAIDECRPSPENDTLYRPALDTDPEIVALAESIRQNGLREPIVLSLDGYILSGHRRCAACKLAGLKKIRARYEPVRREADPDRFVTLLREYNRQRVKSLDEQIRESIVDADPDEARAELVEYRRSKSKVGQDPLSMGDGRVRKSISKAKQPFCDAIMRVLADRRQYWPLSARQVHYALLNNPPLKHASKPGSTYQNTLSDYKSLIELLTRMRLAGLVSFDAVSDETRPVIVWNVHREPGGFVQCEIDSFLKGYYRNLQQSQPNHIEVVVEKNTVSGIVKPVCAEFTVPMTSGRGYCSLPPRHEMARRFRESGKERLIILLVSDFDPDGEEIAASFARSMRDDFGIAESRLHPIKLALTADQVQQFDLPPSMDAKLTSSRTKRFVEQHGKSVWELEALSPTSLQQIVRDGITGVLDLDLFNRELQAEAQDAAKLKVVRERVQQLLAGLSLDGGTV
jgi:hypothetical protein